MMHTIIKTVSLYDIDHRLEIVFDADTVETSPLGTGLTITIISIKDLVDNMEPVDYTVMLTDRPEMIEKIYDVCKGYIMATTEEVK